MKLILRAEDDGDATYLVTADEEATAPYGAQVVVQMVNVGYVVSPPASLGSMAAHDPYTDWQVVEDPPPLAEILSSVKKWPEDRPYPLGRPFLTKEIGEKIIAEAGYLPA